MIRLNHSQFDGFAEALQGVQGQYVLRARQLCDWRLRILDLNGVTVMVGRDGAANIYSGASTPGCFTLFIPLRAHAAVTVAGRRFDRETVAWFAPYQVFHIGADQPTSWMSVTLSSALMEAWLRAHACEANASALARNFCKTASASVTSLIRCVHRLLAVGEDSPDDLHRVAAQEAARRDIVDATMRTVMPMVDCRQFGRPAIDRTRILSHALGVIEAAGHEAVYTADLCRTTGVSERTLRNVFYETFGMAPHKYLLLVRLNQARSAIRSAQPGATLTSICADLGFWDFGHFARHYRQVFGVLPSQALAESRRALPVENRVRSGASLQRG